MRVSDFAFDLPDDLIATRPVEPRDAARLLVHDRAADATTHAHVRDLPRFLAPGDLLVVNDTKVLPNRLLGRRATGARVELLILDRQHDRGHGFVKPARKLEPGESVRLEDGRLAMVVESIGDGGRCRFRLALTPDAAPGDTLETVLDAVGRAPLPPYIRRADDEDPAVDRERYQTVYAAKPGAVAAPTAGLHFTPELLAELAAMGVERTTVTLHVGEGTFAPVRVDDVATHVMHEEVYELGEATAAAIDACRARGGRVVAVGTTACRTLETCATDDRRVRPGAGRTALFLYPGRPLRVVDALFTNFHLPESTLVMLVAAFAGTERTLRLYREAVARRYRFYSYGDAMLLV